MITVKEAENLELNAAGVLFVVILATQEVCDSLTKHIEGLQELNEIQKGILYFLVSYTLLYIAQKQFWTLLSHPDEIRARIFERNLFTLFESNCGINAMSFVSDVAEYTQGKDAGAEMFYLGFKLPQALGLEKAHWVMVVNTRFAAFITTSFTDEFLKKAWDMPEDEQTKYFNSMVENRKQNLKEKDETDEFATMLQKRLEIDPKKQEVKNEVWT